MSDGFECEEPKQVLWGQIILLTKSVTRYWLYSMKKIVPLAGLVILWVLNAVAQNEANTNTVNESQAITNVLIERIKTRFICMRIVIDNGKLVSAQLRPAQYLRALKTIDTAGCPQTFRLAWLDYVQTWERKLGNKGVTENLLESLPALNGVFLGLNDVAKRVAASDTDEAWRHCERVALECGVDASKIHMP